MGAEYSHKCNKCGYSIITSGPWEFYRDNKGKRKYYGHPIPASEEAREAGIYGYSANVYCPNCDQTFDIILEEYEKPQKKKVKSRRFSWFFSIFFPSPYISEPSKLKDEYRKEEAIRCPKCGNTKLVRPDEDNIRIVTCPRCKEGRLIPKREWIS